MQTDFHRRAARLDRRPHHRLSARDPGAARPLLRNLCGGGTASCAGRGPLDRATRTSGPGADLGPGRGRTATSCAPPKTRPRSRACSASTISLPCAVVDAEDNLVGVITHRRRRRRHRGGGGGGHPALGGVKSDEELSDTVVDHTARGRFNWLLVNLATPSSRLPCLGLFEGAAAEDGGARSAGADRREPGRQCRDPDHDGRCARPQCAS